MIYQVDTFWKRLVGLIGKTSIGEDGWYFPQCTAIHSCFMRIPITVIFCDADGKILKYLPSVKPWSLVVCRDAEGVFEFKSNRFSSKTEAQHNIDNYFCTGKI